MASAYSTLHNYQQDLYTPNLELINTALQAKQGKLNANRMKLQTMYDQFSFLDVAKEEDQEYLEGRLQAVKQTMDKYASLDLSSNNLTNQLQANMSSVVDDNVRNAVISTKVYQTEQAAWSKLKEDDPEKYSQVNHAYAGQISNEWLNDGETGTKYRGGGGVIEYTDVQGKMAAEIPKIAKALKSEWVEIASGGGYFRDVVTKERVNRGKLEQAMDGILNEQDRRQLQINAWGQYDGMSDQQLEQNYTAHFAPRIASIESEISSLEGVIASTGDPVLKGQRQELLGFYQDQLESYEANSYQNVAKNYGREAAYSSLYDNQFRGGYLDTYSYMDRVTKIAVYDNDVKSRNYELKLEGLQLKRENQAFNQQLKLEELQLDKNKANGVSGSGTNPGTAPGQDDYVAPLQGQNAVMEYEESLSKIEIHNNNNRKIVKATKDLFGVTSMSQTRELANIFKEGFAGKEFIEFNGKKINVQENLGTLLAYQNNILTQSPVEKEAYEQFSQTINRSLATLMSITHGDSPDWDATTSTPRFNFKFVLDKETGIMKKVEVVGGDINHYADLLGKDNLSSEDKYTLGVYHRMHLLMDPEVDDAQKDVLYQDLLTNQFDKLGNDDYDSFPQDIHAYNRVASRADGSNMRNVGYANESTVDFMSEDGFFERHSSVAKVKGSYPGKRGISSYSGYEGIMTDIVATYKIYSNTTGASKEKARQKIQSLENILDRDTKMLANRTDGTYSDFFISDITADDAEYYNEEGEEVSLKSPSDIMNEGLVLYSNTLETEYKAQDLEPSLYPQIFNTETSGYSDLSSLVGLPAGSKVPITLERVWDPETKQPTGEVKWKYATGRGDNVVVSYSEQDGENRLTVDQLRDNGIINFDEGSRVAYDASWGENASSINLGNNIYDESIKKTNVSKYGPTLGLSVENTVPLLDDARKFGGEPLAQDIKAKRQAFKDGEYSFKMESIGGIWQYSIYGNDGTKLYSEPTEQNGVTTYSEPEVQGIFQESEYLINNIMYNYLQSQVLDAREDYILDYQQEQEQKL